MLLDRATRARSLQDLEGDDWDLPDEGASSGLAIAFRRGRRVPLDELDPDTLKRMIGQRIGMKWLVPLALERLLVEPWLDTPGHGMLIEAILDLPGEYWKNHPQLGCEWERVIDRALREAGAARGKRAPRADPEVIARLESLRRGRRGV